MKIYPIGRNTVQSFHIVFRENFKIENAWNPIEPFGVKEEPFEFKEAVNQLFEISGFPEPFLICFFPKVFLYNRQKEKEKIYKVTYFIVK